MRALFFAIKSADGEVSCPVGRMHILFRIASAPREIYGDDAGDDSRYHSGEKVREIEICASETVRGGEDEHREQGEEHAYDPAFHRACRRGAEG